MWRLLLLVGWLWVFGEGCGWWRCFEGGGLDGGVYGGGLGVMSVVWV